MDHIDDDDAVLTPEKLQQYSEDFNDMCARRHEMGAEKYGPVKFLTADTLEMMIEEIIDMANYARYFYIKLRILQAVGQEVPEAQVEAQIPGIAGWKGNA